MNIKNQEVQWVLSNPPPQANSPCTHMQNSKDEKILNITRLSTRYNELIDISLLNSTDGIQRILQCWWERIANLELYTQLDHYWRFRGKIKCFHIKTEFTTSGLSLKELCQGKGKNQREGKKVQKAVEFWIRKLLNKWVNLNKQEFY